MAKKWQTMTLKDKLKMHETFHPWMSKCQPQFQKNANHETIKNTINVNYYGKNIDYSWQQIVNNARQQDFNHELLKNVSVTITTRCQPCIATKCQPWMFVRKTWQIKMMSLRVFTSACFCSSPWLMASLCSSPWLTTSFSSTIDFPFTTEREATRPLRLGPLLLKWSVRRSLFE